MNNKILVRTLPTQNQNLSAFPRNATEFAESALVELNAMDLSQKLQTFLESFAQVIQPLPHTVGQFQLDTIHLNVAINAEGGIELVGKLTGGVEAGLSLELKRKIP